MNLVLLEYPMLHTNFQGHQPFGSSEEDFLRFLPYMSMVAILVMGPGPFEYGERGGAVVECRTPEREVQGSRPTAAVLCP